MSRPTKFEDYRYLGDKRRLRVHDLDHLLDTCNVEELMASEQFAAFGPDTVAEARNRGYHPCRCVTAAAD
ncbi:MAG: hypothetical protein U0V73_04690 [Acidimicrobiia bacterium]